MKGASEPSSWGELGQRAQSRFVRWDPALWDELGRAAYAALVRDLGENDPAVASYARLAAEAVGRGLVFPRRSGATAFLNRAFADLLPRWLPTLSPPERSELFARTFNLGENLDKALAWVQRLFEARLSSVRSPEELGAVVSETGAKIFAPPKSALGDAFSMAWVPLFEADPPFCPALAASSRRWSRSSAAGAGTRRWPSGWATSPRCSGPPPGPTTSSASCRTTLGSSGGGPPIPG